MKKLFTAAIAAVVLQFSAIAQTEKEVKPILEKYTQEMIDGNWVKSLDYTYPGLYTVVPREQMEQVIITTFSDTSMFIIGFNKMEFGSVTDIYKEDEYNYSFVKYDMEMTMTFTSGVPEESHQTTADMMKMQFGEENVRLDGKTMIITQHNTMAAIKNKGEDKIYFMEVKEQLFPIMGQFMSEGFIANAKAQL